MIRLAAVIAVLAACTSDDAGDDGTPLPACQECGPGAVIAGRFSRMELGPEQVLANRQGTVARVLAGRLAWLGEAFTVDASKTFDHGLLDVAIDDVGGGAVTVGSPSDDLYYNFSDAAVIGLGPDHAQTWRDELGSIFGARVAASSAMIAVMTDAKQIEGTTISSSSHLVGLRASDGSVAWHKPIDGTMAFAPDGTLIVAGTFSGTLDLGGTTTPLTTTGSDGYVAALDPMTGDGRWAVQLAGNATMGNRISAIAVGPSGEVAVAWTPYPTPRGGSLILIDGTGVVRWMQSIDMSPMTLVTDGEHVLLTFATVSYMKPASFAQYSASGMDWQRPITGTGVNEGRVLALAGDRLIGSIYSTPKYRDSPPASTTVGDVTYVGDGLAVVELVH